MVCLAACGGSTGSNGGTPGDGGGGGPGTAPGRYFPNGSPFYQDISDAPVREQSEDMMAWLDSVGGWGTGTMRIDFTIEVVAADADAPVRSFTPSNNHWTPDCDIEDIPLPPGGAIEGYPDYECADGGDCHLIVVQDSSDRLYEMWKADISGDDFSGGCLAVWDMSAVYGPEGRGYDCTSADAAGLPIAPLLFTADEVADGEIAHAIRFILPNSRIRESTYVAPATHSTPATDGPDLAPAYGERLRLRADYPIESLPSEGARVVARAMQRYGIILADGGNIALTAQSDRFTEASWDGLLGPRDLGDIEVTDFEVIDTGATREYDGDCERAD